MTPIVDVAGLRILFRKYKRTASRLRDGLKELAGINLQFNMSVEEGKQPTASFNESSPLYRFAALLRPFMNSESPLELRAVWRELTAVEGLIDSDTRDVMSQNFVNVEDLGGMAFRLNNTDLSSRDLYFAYAEGVFFNEDPEAKKLLDALSSFGPMTAMLPFLFYSTCENYSKLVFAILHVILRIEKDRPELLPERTQPRCIYCLSRDGDFGSEEHVVPEAFGLDELVLVDAACLRCNNELSALDQFLADFEPLAILRVQNVPLTKKGKFPRAETRDFTVEKIKPRVIRFTGKGRERVFSEERLPDGQVKLSTTVMSRRPVDMLRIARAIFKIALGVVAYDAGTEFACDERFSAARAFIRGEGTMPNHLLMPRHTEPTNSIATHWDPQAPTVVIIDIFGVRFAVNLEHRPLAVPAEAPHEALFAFWLGEMTKNGVISPCDVDCSH